MRGAVSTALERTRATRSASPSATVSRSASPSTRGKARWGQLLPGAVLIGLGTTVLILAVQVLAPNEITEQVADYGLVGAAFILALVLVAFSTILLWGVFLGRDLSRWLVARRFDAAHSSDNPDATTATATATAIDTGAAPAVLEGPVTQPTAAL